MPSLRELQADFARCLRAPATEDGSLAVPPALANAVRPGALDVARRLQVYRNNHQASLRDALGDVYPVVRQLVGEGFFSWLAHEFTQVHPSRSGNLHDFGAELAGFLRGFEAAASLPYLPDVARLEWAWHRAFHAAEHAPLDAPALAAVPPASHPNLRFALHPSAGLVRSTFPVFDLWSAHQRAGDVVTVDLGAGAQHVLVLRSGVDVDVVSLTPGESAMLASLAEGLRFEVACERAVAQDPGTDLATVFSRHVAMGTLVDFRIQP